MFIHVRIGLIKNNCPESHNFFQDSWHSEHNEIQRLILNHLRQFIG